MKKISIYFVLALCLFNSLLSATILKDFYHDNHGTVERVVFVFNNFPRYRIREDDLAVNITFLETSKVPELKTKDIYDNLVISRIALVPTDHFLGTLINTFQHYRMDYFILESGDEYKFVVDVFKYKIPPNSSTALEYAAFYKTMGNATKSAYYEMLADSLANAGKITEPPLESEPVKEEPIYIQKPQKEIEPDTPEEVMIPETEIKENISEQKNITQVAEKEPQKKSYLKKFPERIPEIIADIYKDKMLMFSITIVFGLILIMLIMSLIRKLHKHKKITEEIPSNSYGTQEFQRVTIKRLLANGWQVKEIARELNITPEQVEELGRGIS